MTQLIETLEMRTLLSANPANVPTDIANLKAAAHTTLTDLKAAQTTFKNDLAPIVADLKRLNGNSANAGLLTKLKKDGLGSLSRLTTDVKNLVNTANHDLNRILADQRALLRRPTSTVFLGRLVSDLAVLRQYSSTLQIKVVADATTADDLEETDLTAISTANSGDAQTQTDVTKAKTDSAKVITIATNDLGAVGNAASSLAFDLGG